MRRTWIISLAGSLLCLSAVALRAQTPQPVPSSFVTCIGPYGSGNPCQLPPGIWLVTSPLVIGRSGITITGTATAGPGDTVLRREFITVDANTPKNSIMYAGNDLSNNPVTNVTISYLTFDGNRYAWGTAGAGVSCLNSQASGPWGQAAFVDLYLLASSGPH